MLDERMTKALEERGLDPEIAVKLGFESYEKNGLSWLKIPYLVGADVVNHKHRTLCPEKRMHQDAGAKMWFWNFNVLADESLQSSPIIITEGEMDAMAAIQAGFVRAVSVPNGAPQETDRGDSQRYEYMDAAEKYLSDAKEVIICSDADAQGANLLHDLTIRIGARKCKFVKYPKGCKDLNDALRVYGIKGVSETIHRAQWVPVGGVYSMSQLPPAPEATALSTGFHGMDSHFKMRLGDFTVVTGIPSMGKTTFVTDLCCRMVRQYGWSTCFASFEQHPSLDHKRNLTKWILERPPPYSRDEVEDANKWIERNFSFLVPAEEDDVDLGWVLERCAVAVIRFGAKIVVIDPWNEMDHSYPRDMTLTQYTGYAIKEFRKFARKYNIHLILVAHPAKQKKSSGGTFDIPSLYDISDSSHFFNKADIGIVVHRDEHGSLIRVAKSRYHDILGRPGDMRAFFNAHMNRFEMM